MLGTSREGKNGFKELQPNSLLQRLRGRHLVALKVAFIITTSGSNGTARAGLTCGGACTSRSGGLPSSGTPRRSCTARRTPRAPGTPAREAKARAQRSSRTAGERAESSSRSCFAGLIRVTQQRFTKEFISTSMQESAEKRIYWGLSREVTPSLGRSHAANHGRSGAAAPSPAGIPAPARQEPSRPPRSETLPG